MFDSQPLAPAGQGTPAASGVPAPFTFHRAPWKPTALAAAAAGCAGTVLAMLPEVLYSNALGQFIPGLGYGPIGGALLAAMVAAYVFTHRPGGALLSALVFGLLMLALTGLRYGVVNPEGYVVAALVAGGLFEAVLSPRKWTSRNPFWLWLGGTIAVWVPELLRLNGVYFLGFVEVLYAGLTVLVLWAVSNRVNRRTGVGLPVAAGYGP
jgi:hypothetical protein